MKQADATPDVVHVASCHSFGRQLQTCLRPLQQLHKCAALPHRLRLCMCLKQRLSCRICTSVLPCLTAAIVYVCKCEGRTKLQVLHARHIMLAGLQGKGVKYWRTGTREEFQWWPPPLPLAWVLTEQVSIAGLCCTHLQLIPSS